MPKTVLMFIGTAGAGKSYISKQVAALLDASHVSSGDIVRSLPDAQADLAAGDLYKNDQLVVDHTAKFIASSTSDVVVIDGVPRNKMQVNWIKDTIWKEYTCCLICVDAPLDKRMQRIVSRSRDEHDAVDTVLKRLPKDLEMVNNVTEMCSYVLGSDRMLMVNSEKDSDTAAEVSQILEFVRKINVGGAHG